MAVNSQNKTVRWLIILLVALVVIVPVGMAIGMYSAGNGTAGDTRLGMMDSFGGGWWVVMLIPVIVIVLILVVLISLIMEEPTQMAPPVQTYPAQYNPQYGAQNMRADEPQAILDRRLASGEMGVDEYNRLKDELRKR